MMATKQTSTATETAPYVLFIGETASADTLQKALVPAGGYVYHPQTLMEALGIYITMLPRIIVIDTCAPFASEVYLHLRSVDARPILLLTHANGFKPMREAGISCLPRNATSDELAQAVIKLASAPGIKSPVACAPLEYLDEAVAFTN